VLDSSRDLSFVQQDKAGANRGMSREIHFAPGSENSHTRCAILSHGRKDEGRLRKIQFPGNFCHRDVIKPSSIGKNGEGISFQGAVREDVTT
jgi:hypothetical protein